jgi:hypothetical protein
VEWRKSRTRLEALNSYIGLRHILPLGATSYAQDGRNDEMDQIPLPDS